MLLYLSSSFAKSMFLTFFPFLGGGVEALLGNDGRDDGGSTCHDLCRRKYLYIEGKEQVWTVPATAVLYEHGGRV